MQLFFISLILGMGDILNLLDLKTFKENTEEVAR